MGWCLVAASGQKGPGTWHLVSTCKAHLIFLQIMCALIISLESLPLEAIVTVSPLPTACQTRCGQRNASPLFAQFPRYFVHILFLWKFNVTVAKPHCQALLPIDQREVVRSFLVDYVRMDFYFYFPVLVYLLTMGLLLFQFMLTSSINCIILNWSPFL